MTLASSIVGRLHRSGGGTVEGRMQKERFRIDEGMQATEDVQAVVSLVWLFADRHAQRRPPSSSAGLMSCSVEILSSIVLLRGA